MQNVMVFIGALLMTVAGSAGMTPRVSVEAVPNGTDRAELFRAALSWRALADGSQWITHRLTGYQEGSPIGATRLAPNGVRTSFTAAEWLPEGTVAPNTAGQVYAIADLQGGLIAAAVGWHRDGRSHNAIVLLRPREDRYDAVRVIEVAGVSSLVGGPGGSIVAITDDASRAGGGPLVTVLDREGTVLGAFFTGQGVSAGEAARNSLQSSLQHVHGSRYALYDAARESLVIFDLHVSPSASATPARHWVRAAGPTGAARIEERAAIFIGGDASLSQTRVVSTLVDAGGRAVVARTGLVAGVPGTVVTVYEPDGEVAKTWRAEYPWNLVLRRGRGLTGVAIHRQVTFESIELPEAE